MTNALIPSAIDVFHFSSDVSHKEDTRGPF